MQLSINVMKIFKTDLEPAAWFL